MTKEITILGCGTSLGVPYIGCNCQVCNSTNPKNNRLRSSILLNFDNTKILIDSSTDLRQQAIRNNINNLDAVIYTHAHSDHTHGIDELRSFSYLQKRTIPIYGEKHTLNELKNRFSYMFSPLQLYNIDYPTLIGKEVEFFQTFKINDVEILPFKQIHDQVSVLGLRFGDIAYSTDVNILPEESIEVLKGIKLWILDCIGHSPSKSHSNFSSSLNWIKMIKPELTILTHMGHEIDYEELSAKLPSNIILAYDGMSIKI